MALATSAFPDVAWDAEAALETLLLELNAHVGGVVLKYLNNTGRESRWGTALQRRNLLSLIKLIGYKPPGARAAQFVETFTLSGAAAAQVTIPAGTVVRTSDVQGVETIRFQLLSDVVFAPGQTSLTGTVEHSQTQSESYVSDGLAAQSFTLGKTPYLDGSIMVAAADGTYTEVSNFLASGATDRHFTTTVDDLDRVTVRFGDGATGSIPSGTITFTYKTGGGANGNVSAGKINRLEGTFTDANGTPVVVSVTNASTNSTPGVDRTSAAQIRELAPLSLRVLGRAVAREDFEIGALQVSGVARALHLTRNEEPGVQENGGILFVVPETTFTDGLKDLILAQFFGTDAPYPCLQTFQLTVQEAAYITIDLVTKVYIRQRYTAAAVAADIRARLTDFFKLRITPSRLWELAPDVARSAGVSQRDATSQIKNPLVDFGYALQDVDGNPVGSFAWSDLFNLVRDTPGVLRVAADTDGLLLNGNHADVYMTAYQFPKIGTVTIYNAADGSSI